MKLLAVFLCCMSLSLFQLSAQDSKPSVPKGFEKVDQVIKLGTRHGDIRFDKESISIQPGKKIRIDFKNTDEMPHNMVICKPGTSTKMIGELALKMGAEGLKAGYIPKSDKILWSMPMVEPGQSATIYFQAPKEKCILPFVCTVPGHYLKMIGTLNVGMKAKAPKKPKKSFEIVIKDQPYIYRSGINIPGVGKKAYSVAVGLPGGMNYIFDAESCTVTAAWTGKFLDAKKDWDGRGGNGAAIVGKVFYTNKSHKTLYLPKKGGIPKYSGYRVHKGVPTFIYFIGTNRVSLTVSSVNGKLVKKYTVTGVPYTNYVGVPKAKLTVEGKPLVNGEFQKVARPTDGMLVFEVEVAP